VFAGNVHLEKGPCPSSDNISKWILDLVQSKESQELEETIMISSTSYDNSNGIRNN
jgi:hypothetical protein